MARDSSTVRVGFLGDASQLAREAQKASRSVQSVGDSASRMGERMGKAFALGAAGAATAAVALGRQAINAASDLSESLSKNQAVFGQSADTVRKWANDSSKNILLTRQAAIEGAATFGNLFTSMGLGQGTAAGLSTKLVGLASDLSSFNNVPTDEALLALRSGLLGEAEPLRKFGVQLSAARIEAEAFALGLAKPVKNAAAITAAQNKVAAAVANVSKVEKEHGKGTLAAAQAQDTLSRAEAGLTKAMGGQKTELTAVQKAQAAYSIIMKDTATAQGDAERTQDGYANKTRILRKQLADLSAEIGMKLLPYAASAADYLSDLVTEFQNGTGDGGRLRDTMKDLAGAAKSMGDAITPVIRFLSDHKTVFGTIAYGIGSVILVAKVQTLFSIGAGLTSIGVGATAAGVGATSMLGPIGLAVGAVAGLSYAIAQMTREQEHIDNILNGTKTATIGPGPTTPKTITFGDETIDLFPSDPNRHGQFDPSEHGAPRPGRNVKSAQDTAKAAQTEAQKQAAATKAASDKVMGAQKYAADQAAAIAKRKQDAADALQKSNDAMRAALEDRQNTARSIRDSLISSNSVVRQGMSWTAKDLLDRFRTQMDKVRRFSAAIQEMVRKGFAPSIVRQVADAGVSGGYGTAIGLARASAGQVRQFNAVQGGIDRAAGYAGNAVASQMGPIQITTKVMLNDRELARAVNTWNAENGGNGHRLAS